MAPDVGKDQVVKYLLERGAKIEATDETGLTPLLCASMNGRLQVVKQLLNRVPLFDRSQTLLHQKAGEFLNVMIFIQGPVL